MYDAQAFQNLDENNDGFLTKKEMSKLLQSLTSEQVNVIECHQTGLQAR